MPGEGGNCAGKRTCDMPENGHWGGGESGGGGDSTPRKGSTKIGCRGKEKKKKHREPPKRKTIRLNPEAKRMRNKEKKSLRSLGLRLKGESPCRAFLCEQQKRDKAWGTRGKLPKHFYPETSGESKRSIAANQNLGETTFLSMSSLEGVMNGT